MPHHLFPPARGSKKAWVRRVPAEHVDGLRDQMIHSVANPAWNPWESDRGTLDLYRRRCRQQAEEMTCARQAADILKTRIEHAETLLDAGCGGGYYAHSFQKRGV